MRSNRITRRDCARALALAAMPAAANEPHVLENSALRCEIALRNGSVAERRFVNKLANDASVLRAPEFLLEFDNGAMLTASDFSVKPGAVTADRIELLFTKSSGPLSGLEVKLEYHLPSGKRYLRKQISVRKHASDRAKLMRVDLDDWRGVKRRWQSMHADRLPYGSHPVFCENLWAGVEFVAAFNEYGNDGFVLRSRPGGRTIGPDWLTLHSTVVGAAETGRVRDAFLEYLEDIRLAPPRLVACYNSWWTLPKVVKQAENLELIADLKAKLYDRHGVFFDIITTDMGWSNPRTIWQIDRSILPQGFNDIRSIVEPAGGKLGLWMSPSEVYPPVCDYEWAEKNGYVVLWSNRDRSGRKRFALSLADPKYRNEVTAQLKNLIRDSNLGHIKYDGFAAKEENPHHSLLAEKDSVEPLAAYSLELIQVSKAQNPDLITEPTYMNSLANYISPWILKYSDTVWGNSGGDCPLGIGPAPEYRESHTNAREYYIFSSLNEFWLPQNAVHYFDIVHCDSGAGFPNHAAMAFGRGRFFVSTYLNPKFMNEDDWRIYAGLLKWARANRDILRNTRVLPSRVELGEPYAYAHWLGARGILVARNPSNETKEFAIDLARSGAPQELDNAVCYTQYPYRKGIAAGLTVLTGQEQAHLAKK
jgi:Melibiase